MVLAGLAAASPDFYRLAIPACGRADRGFWARLWPRSTPVWPGSWCKGCPYSLSLRGRRLKGKGKGVLGARESRFPSRPKPPFPSLSNACHAGYYSLKKKKSQTKNQTKKRQGINFKMQKNQLWKQLLSTMKLCLVQKKILKHRKRNGKVEYLVKWLSFPKNKSTLEPEHHIFDRRLIDNYLQSYSALLLGLYFIHFLSPMHWVR